MKTFIEPLVKTENYIDFGWNSEPGAVQAYKIYVGLAPISLTLLYPLGTPNLPSTNPGDRGKITKRVQITEVQSVLGLASTQTFLNTVFYFAITYVDTTGSESPVADSRAVEVPPVGITPRTMRDDPSINRHGYVFSDGIQKWVKMAGSSTGGVCVDGSDYYKANVTTEYTYDGTDMSTAKSYLTDATTGAPAKLTTYEYTGGLLTKVTVSDSTV